MIIGYEAIDGMGALVRDQLVVEDAAQAYGELRRRGLVPVRVAEASASSGPRAGWRAVLRVRLARHRRPDARRASRRDVAFFTEQMAILLETGTPVAASLAALQRQMTCPHWQMLVGQLRQQVEEGASLAAAVASFEHIFDSVYRAMVAAGEASGTLGGILTRLAAMSRQVDRIRRKVVSALIYPALLTCVALAAVTVLIFFVLPRFSRVFVEMRVNLPGSTRGLLACSGFVRQYLAAVLGVLAAGVTGAWYWFRSDRGRRLLARAAVRTPIVGPLVRSVTHARLFRLIGLLIDSRVPLLDALELTRGATRNYLYAALLAGMRENVVNGRPMHEAMNRGNLMPPSMAQMVRTGEENAQLGRVMLLLADHLDDRNETQIGTLTSVLEPLILVFMGAVIGTVAISLVLPMFDLSRISA